jgi:hypothetical protein
MLDLTTETEEVAADHSAENEAEEAMLAYLAKLGLTRTEDGQIVAAEESAAVRKVVICSCGYFTCASIGLYGHPVPVYTEAIEPLFPQSRRDRRAIQLKG